MECPLCGATKMSNGEPFESEGQVVSHIFSSGDKPHKGYNYQDAKLIVAGKDTGDTGTDTGDETPEPHTGTDGGGGQSEEAEEAEAGAGGSDPAAAAPGGGDGGGDDGHGEECPKCGASTSEEGLDDVREHDTVETANGALDVSEIDFVCWNCREAYTQQ